MLKLRRPNKKAREKVLGLGRKCVSAIMCAVLTASSVLGALTPVAAHAAPRADRQWTEVLGVDRVDLVNKMEANAGRYLGVPYRKMPCNAFVARAIRDAGYGFHEKTVSGWKAWAEQNGVYRISVGSRDEVIALGRAGKISKGDIVLCNVGKSNEHMGFYWGDAGNGFDQMWHSLTTTNGVRYYKNAKTPIGGKGYAQTFTILATMSTGDLALHKESANPGCTAGNELYSLAGARYDVFRDPGLSNKAATLTTDASGNASASGLQAGTYYVKEAVAPEGYLLDETVYTVDVPTGGTGYVNGGTVQDKPINDPAIILLGKFDGEKTYNGQANLPQGSASLAGAEFTVRYYDGFYDTEQQAEASGEPTRTWVFATDADGYVDYQNETYLVSGDPLYTQDGLNIVPRGTLVIRETKAPEGYELNTDFVSVQKIKAPGDSSSESTYNTPTTPEQVKRGGLAVTKVDAQTGATPQGDADFKGIEFSIVNDGGNDVKVGGKDYKPGQVVAKITTDGSGRASTAADALPYGDYILRETKGNDGYLADSPEIKVRVSEKSTLVSVTARDNIKRGGVEVEKRDLESDKADGLGSATLDGTTFQVKSLNDNPVMVDGVKRAKGDVVATLVIKDGRASTRADLLPHGSYSIQEVEVGDGYLLTDGDVHEFKIERDGKMVNPIGDAFRNQVKRGDIEFVKVREDDMGRLAGIPFLITSETTGESHVLVTDENGQAKTSADWNKHTVKTNANDEADEADLDSSAGIWFGQEADGNITAPDDTLGALPYDTYSIEELPVAANDGLQLVKIDGIVVKRDGQTVDLGTIDDRNETEAYIHTTAHDQLDGDKIVDAVEDAKITDHVEYTGLTPGAEYVMTATLMDRETGKAVNEPVSKAFTPKGPSGSVEMVLTADTIDLAGGKAVVFEELTRDGKAVCDHKDIEDTEQTVMVVKPEIGTTARDGGDGGSTAVIDPEAKIVDTVSYKGLAAGREYKVAGKLMDKETGKALLDKDGREVTSEATFTPTEASGTVEVAFDLDASELEGKSIIVFERLYRLDRAIAAHEDIDDAGQTVAFTAPAVATAARDGADGDSHASIDPETVVIDTVRYTGLNAGREYTVRGTLMDKATGEALKIDGKKVRGETKFTPETPDGQIDVVFKFDSTELAGKDVVVFERLYRGDAKLAEHTDIADAAQTVGFDAPEIATQATDGDDGDKAVAVHGKSKVVDTVSYTGLTPGREYKLVGKLMDKESGEPLTGADDKPVEAQTTFTPDAQAGTVEVVFEFDSLDLAGTEAVAFEKLYRLDKAIASHEDIDDEGQTVTFTQPTVATEASDASDGDKVVTNEPEVAIKDLVSISGAKPNGTYTALGIIMDATTGLPLLTGEPVEGEMDELEQFWAEMAEATGVKMATTLNEGGAENAPTRFSPSEYDPAAIEKVLASHPDIAGRIVTSTAETTAEAAQASCEVSFKLDASKVHECDAVVYEFLVQDGHFVAAHADIASKAQTVKVAHPAIATEATDRADGDHELATSKRSTVVDRVTYSNLIPGKEYVLNGKLMDKKTGEPLKVDGEEVASELRFTPNQPSGEVELSFTFDSTELDGHELVAFEYLSKDGIEVARHADIDDAAQTVKVVKPADGQAFAKTGFDGSALAGIAGLGAVAAAGLVAYGRRQKSLESAEADDGEE